MIELAYGVTVLNTSLRMEDVYQRILMQMMQAQQAETVALGMIDGEHLIFRAVAGYNAELILGRKILIGDGIVGHVAREGRGMVVADVSQEKSFSEADMLGGVEMRAFLVAPIQAQGKVIGVLEAINPVARVLDRKSTRLN